MWMIINSSLFFFLADPNARCERFNNHVSNYNTLTSLVRIVMKLETIPSTITTP